MNKEFNAYVFTIDKGMTEYKNINLIRIKSEEYNLLIMKDYVPIIGYIDGSIEIDNNKYENIKAFYMSRDNIFNLIIRSTNV